MTPMYAVMFYQLIFLMVCAYTFTKSKKTLKILSLWNTVSTKSADLTKYYERRGHPKLLDTILDQYNACLYKNVLRMITAITAVFFLIFSAQIFDIVVNRSVIFVFQESYATAFVLGAVVFNVITEAIKTSAHCDIISTQYNLHLISKFNQDQK